MCLSLFKLIPHMILCTPDIRRSISSEYGKFGEFVSLDWGFM